MQNPNEDDLSATIVRSLSRLDLKALSFVQMRRLHTALTVMRDNIEAESAIRSGAENLGDTVIVNATKQVRPR